MRRMWNAQTLSIRILVYVHGKLTLAAQCKTAVTPLLTHWSYCSLALSPQHIMSLPIMYNGSIGSHSRNCLKTQAHKIFLFPAMCNKIWWMFLLFWCWDRYQLIGSWWHLMQSWNFFIWCHGPWSILVWVMACCLKVPKPKPEPKKTWYQLNTPRNKFQSSFTHNSNICKKKKNILKYCQQIRSHLVQA